MSDAIVTVQQLSRVFGRTVALADVTLTVARGAVFGLVGENGAGKTTLIKHLLGLYRPEYGQVRVFGSDPVSDPVGVLASVLLYQLFRSARTTASGKDSRSLKEAWRALGPVVLPLGAVILFRAFTAQALMVYLPAYAVAAGAWAYAVRRVQASLEDCGEEVKRFEERPRGCGR